MNKKLLQLLQDKSKDFGLTQKFIEGIAEDASKEIKEDAKDEDIEALANSLALIAKHTQGEVTRKLQEKKPTKPNNTETEPTPKPELGNEPPAWFAEYKAAMDKQLKEATSELTALRSERTKAERQGKISAKAKELGIPDYLLKRCSFADDADIDKELTDFKQELVTNALLPAGATAEKATSEAAAKTEAEEWAKTLPDK